LVDGIVFVDKYLKMYCYSMIDEEEEEKKQEEEID